MSVSSVCTNAFLLGTIENSSTQTDTDVMVWEKEDDAEAGPSRHPTYPPQLYSIIENFCLGARRLDLFAPEPQARRGWVTVGPGTAEGLISRDNLAARAEEFDPTRYTGYLSALRDSMGRCVLPLTAGESFFLFWPSHDQLPRSDDLSIAHTHSLSLQKSIIYVPSPP